MNLAHKTRSVILIFVAMLLASCGGGGGGGSPPPPPPPPTINEIEPNDTVAQVQVVTFPATISGSTSGDILDSVPAVDLDAYRFTLASAQTVTIVLTGGTSQDMDLSLFDSGGMEIGFSIGDQTSNETITMSLVAGTYDVVVFPFLVDVTTTYTLSIQ